MERWLDGRDLDKEEEEDEEEEEEETELGETPRGRMRMINCC